MTISATRGNFYRVQREHSGENSKAVIVMNVPFYDIDLSCFVCKSQISYRISHVEKLSCKKLKKMKNSTKTKKKRHTNLLKGDDILRSHPKHMRRMLDKSCWVKASEPSQNQRIQLKDNSDEDTDVLALNRVKPPQNMRRR